jgi:hypothetical protein
MKNTKKINLIFFQIKHNYKCNDKHTLILLLNLLANKQCDDLIFLKKKLMIGFF